MTITTELVLFFIAAIGAISGVWWRVEAKITTARNEAISAAAEAKAKAEAIAKDLSDHRLHASDTFATKTGLTEALNRVHDALDKLTNRIDVLISKSLEENKRAGQ